MQDPAQDRRTVFGDAPENGESTNFADGTFDFVMLNGGVASYTPEPEKLIRETRRILKTNGRIWFDFYNSTGWAIELSEPKRKKDIAASDNELIKMEDWKYPARVMSIRYVERMLHDNGFTIKSKYGLICISHSIPLEFRYSTTYSRELAKEYGEVELALSRREDCIGTAWSCIICAKNNKDQLTINRFSRTPLYLGYVPSGGSTRTDPISRPTSASIGVAAPRSARAERRLTVSFAFCRDASAVGRCYMITTSTLLQRRRGIGRHQDFQD